MLIALDTETGGLDPTVHPLLHVSLWQPEGPCFDVRVCGDPHKCDPRALQANGLDPTFGNTPKEAAEKLFTWWKGIGAPRLHLVGQNVGPLDVPFAKQLTKVGVDLPWDLMFDYHYRDTGSLALALQDAGILHFGKLSLTNVCQVLGILYNPHLARDDARAAWYAWHRMIAVLQFYHKFAVDNTVDVTDLPAMMRADVLKALDLRG